MRSSRAGTALLPWLAGFGLGALAGALAALRAGPRAASVSRVRRAPRARRRAFGWDIAPGESLMANGERDLVLEASLESFPASDPPALTVDREA